MTIKELIQYLSQLPDDLDVMVRGYEGGFDIVNKIEKVSLFKNPTDHEYEGNFIYPDDRKLLTSPGMGRREIYPIHEQEEAIDTVILHGDSR